MKMQLTKSHDGNPVRLENMTLPFLSNFKAAHARLTREGDGGILA